ncbi:hypothetical protein PFAG_01110 [Plasmodium falciparum Santa Lucia]|uniref:Uncharacterized protein n=12 Tax=Plasmodium falciparum TaxID=5833 RepID=Q8I3M0_PLAF7|nr:conserved Plasmodium protein, unknown function [Plasmodium falciparum 3D7]ETW31811.1 hypothetical protein PFFCH_00777 [Plasmodium falciparum FCH/4]ETW38118.1 hypothetical protein PFTANZ_01218 [Plasmodium falciparum Tanzania (2000708)]ETW44377.1 hypothetical protein PFNF135_01243 [Plasmodium falciparum NF135/5.C10]ETW50765.1 hypothetical protein PFMALIP_01213 [Plasmodium falciparum MaliPS096_E11]ETW53396.1 hypothetical protein PFUGPA_04411 [Plasmodium falciparum Palo Alto/Uganda]ETW63185.1 |eukprot:XP_001351801.1 conserved Plasmodium protein, unknown function [Plasmodium falciparum 3D7]
MEGLYDKYDLRNNNISLLEMSSEEDLKVNIINNNKNLVEYYNNILKNKQTLTNVTYFNMDITDDIVEMNNAFSDPLKINEESDDNVEYKINQFLSLYNKPSSGTKVLYDHMDITVHCEQYEQN